MHNIKILEVIKEIKKSNKNKIVKEEKEIVLEINMEEKKYKKKNLESDTKLIIQY